MGVTGAVRRVEPAVEGKMSNTGGVQSALREVIPVVRGAQPAVLGGHADWVGGRGGAPVTIRLTVKEIAKHRTTAETKKRPARLQTESGERKFKTIKKPAVKKRKRGGRRLNKKSAAAERWPI